MSTTTQIGVVEDALKVLIAARPALVDIPVEVSMPIRMPTDDHIWISGDTDEWTQEPMTTDPDEKETFVLDVHCWARRSTDDYKEVRDRAIALATEVQAAIRGDRHIGGTVFDSFVVGGKKKDILDDQARICDLTVRVLFQVHLQ